MIPPLIVRIGTDDSELQRGLSSAINRVGEFSRGVGQRMQAAGEATQRLGRSMLPISGAVSSAGAALFGLAANTARAGNEIAKTARAAGMGTDAWQEYRFALGQATDASDADLSMATRNLTRVMREASDGSEEAIATLQRLGFSAEDAASGVISAEDALGAAIQALGETADATQAASLGADLFGERLGATLGPQLRETAGSFDALRQQARDLGLILSEDTLAASEAATDKFAEIRAQIGAAGHIIGAAMLPALISLADVMQRTVLPALVRMAEGVGSAIEWFSALPDWVQSAGAVIAAVLGIGGPVLMAVGAAMSALGGLAVLFGPLGLLALAIGAGVAIWIKWGDEIKAVVGAAVDWLVDRFGWLADFYTTFWGGMIEQAMNFVDFFRSVFAGDFEGALDALVEIFALPFRVFADILEIFVGDFRGTFDDVVQYGSDKLTELVGYIRGLATSFYEVGRAVVEGLWNGLVQAWEEFSIVDTVRGWGSGIADSIRGVLGIQSPSRVFHEIGQNIGEGLRNGIVSTFGMVNSAVTALANNTTSSAFSMASDVVGAMGQMFEGSKPIAMAQALINTFQGITEALKLPFPANIGAAIRVGAQGFAAVRGIQSARPGSGVGGLSSAGANVSGGSGGGQAMAPPTQTVIIDAPSGMDLRELVGMVNEAHKRGYFLRFEAS